MGQPSVTIYVDYKGTPHTFIGLDDGNGKKDYYGFAPATAGAAHGAGKVGIGLATHAQGDPSNSAAGFIDDVGWSKPIPITSAQYQIILDAKEEWRQSNHTYDFASLLGGENCTDFVNAMMKAGGVDYPGRSEGFQPINLIPSNERTTLWTVDAQGNRTMSDVLRDPLNTPGTPAYEFKQAHPEMFAPQPSQTGTQDLNSSDMRWNADGSYTEDIAWHGSSVGDVERIHVTSDGHVSHIIETDGASDNADYGTRTTTYDTQGRTDWIDVRRDDGTRDTTHYDQNSTQAWSRVESRFDAQGREDYANVFVDDGSRTFHDYDQTNARGDRTSQTHVDAQGRTDWTYVIQDDGSVDSTDYDQANERGDSTWRTHVDAQGRTDWTYATLDDGGHDWTDYDQTGARGDSIWQNRTDAQGREDWRYVTLDDGGNEWTDFDQTGARGDSSVQSRTDAWGRQDWVNIVQDDGSRDWTDHDQDGSQGWSRVESHFDAWGREAHATMYQDDGSRDWHDYDQDGSQGWSALISHFDASGREAHANLYMDDGSRNWVDYDEDGSQAWSRVESRFDASGREDEATMFFDDGRRRRDDYDQDGSQYWSRVEQEFDAFGRETTANIFHDNGARTLVDYSSAPGYRLVSRYNAQGYLILKEEATAWLPGGPLPVPLPPAVGPLPAMPFYASPSAAPHNPFISPAFPFPSQPSWSIPAVDDDPYPDAYVEVGALTPSGDW